MRIKMLKSYNLFDMSLLAGATYEVGVGRLSMNRAARLIKERYAEEVK